MPTLLNLEGDAFRNLPLTRPRMQFIQFYLTHTVYHCPHLAKGISSDELIHQIITAIMRHFFSCCGAYFIHGIKEGKWDAVQSPCVCVCGNVLTLDVRSRDPYTCSNRVGVVWE